MNIAPVIKRGKIDTFDTLAQYTVDDLRAAWRDLAAKAKAAGLNPAWLRSCVVDDFYDCPRESFPIYATRDFAERISLELAVARKTGRKVWETRFAGERVLVDEMLFDGSRGDEIVRSVFPWWK